MDEKGGIGFNGTMPWPRNADDMRRFKRLTVDEIVVMGRSTWDDAAMPKPLVDRVNVVITNRDLDIKQYADRPNPWSSQIIPASGDLEIVVDMLLKYQPYRQLWFIGGANLLYQAAPMLEQIWLTRLSGDFHCDTFLNLERLMGVGMKDFELIYTEFAGYTGYNITNEVWQRL